MATNGQEFVNLANPGSGLWGLCVLKQAKEKKSGGLSHKEMVHALRERPPPEWLVHTSG